MPPQHIPGVGTFPFSEELSFRIIRLWSYQVFVFRPSCGCWAVQLAYARGINVALKRLLERSCYTIEVTRAILEQDSAEWRRPVVE